MRETGKTLRVVVWALAFLVLGIAQSMADGTFPGLLQPGQVVGNNGTSAAPAGAVSVWRYAAQAGGMPLYAAPTAQGSGNCLSAGNACTLATACTLTSQIATFLGPAGPIFLADGTYTGSTGATLCQLNGDDGGSTGQLISIVGNTTTPTNVIIQVPASGIGFNADDKGYVGVNDLQINGGNNSIGIAAGKSAVSDYSNVYWGSWGSGGSHVAVQGNGSTANLLNNEYLTAGFTGVHWNVAPGANFNGEGITNINSTISWTGGSFLAAAGTAVVDLSGWSTAGAGVSSSTGQNASLAGPGYLITKSNASCASVVPGNGGCGLSLGFQVSSGEGFSGSGRVVLQSSPTIFDPIVGAHTYAGLPTSPLAGQTSHILDGNASNCGDGVCTTPGVVITGGGGSLDLLLGYDGSNWRILRAQAVPALANLSGSLALGKISGFGTGVATALGSATNATGGPVIATAGCTSWNSSLTDQSGGGLTFTSVNVQYCQYGNMVFAYGTLTYPSTADTHSATISLPVAVPNQTYAALPSTFLLNSTTGSPNKAVLRAVANTSTAQVVQGDGSTNIYTNANLSGVKITFMLIYPAS
jgi:hypothetical protein